MDSIDDLACSFCKKKKSQGAHIIVGDFGANICKSCWEIAGEVFTFETKRYYEIGKKTVPTPQEIFNHLEKYIIGQDAAKRSLSVAVYNHYKRISPFQLKQPDSVEVQKSNVLLLGPTGTGKTYLAQSLARIMGVPFVIVDATALTEAGYVGEDVESILLRLIQEAEGDVEAAQKGIVYIDEIDKLARRGESASLTKDVSGEGVQQGLLKIIEGTVAQVQPTTGRKHSGQEFISIDTSDILFIASGAFSGLEEIIHNRKNKASVGFGAPIKKTVSPQSSIFKDAETEDLHKFGLIPEFVGRFPVMTYVNPLSLDDMKRILTEPMNSIIKQYKKLFELDNVYLQFEEDAIDEIAEIALSKKNGARSLRSVVEKVLEPVMFEIPSRNDIEGVVVSAENVRKANKVGEYADSSNDESPVNIDDAETGEMPQLILRMRTKKAANRSKW